MTSADIAQKTGAAIRTICKWAENNNVKYTGEGKRKIYTWNEENLKQFINRSPRGRPKKKT